MPATRSKSGTKRSARRRQTVARQPRPWITPPRTNIRGEVLQNVVLIGSDMEADITGAITAAPLRASRVGAPQLSISVADPDRELLSAGGLLDRDEDMLLDDNIDAQIGGVWWRLLGMESDEQGVTLSTEDRAGAWLRRHRRHKKWVRGVVNRAQVMHSVYREAGGGIDLYVPELHDRQAIASSSSPTGNATAKPASSARSAGGKVWPASTRPTVKHQGADDEQLRVLVAVLEECRRLGCSRRVMIAAVMCVTQEAVARRLNHGDGPGPDSRGPYQQRAPWGSLQDRMNPTTSTRMFLTGGKGGQPGWRQKHGSLRNGSGSLDRMITAVQVSVGGYGQWEAEAAKTVDLWLKAGGGAGAASEAGGTTGRSGAYVFERGADGKTEDSLVFANRLAEEVPGWNHWIFGNTGVFASDEELIAAPVGLILHRDDEAVVSVPRWKIDARRSASEASCEVIVDRLPEPGQVAMFEDEGPASGLWLIDTVECDLAQPVDTRGGGLALRASLTFVRAGRKQKEPSAATAGSTTGTDQATSGGKLQRRGNKVTGGTLRERIVFAAEEAARLHKAGQRQSFYAQPGSWTVSKGITGEAKGQRSDCSQWLIAMYWSAGAKDPAGNSFDGGNTVSLYQHADRVSKPLPGDICLYGAGGSKHCELYVGSGKTIGHGSAPVDYATPHGIPGFIGYYRPRVLKGES